jgi:hypothetical protein
VTSEEMAAVIAMWQAVGDTEDKFTASKLSLGNPEDSDLREFLGLEDNVIYANGMEDPVKAMKLEWREHGSEKDWANFRYVLEGVACDPEWVPPHVKEFIASGVYHGGALSAADFDAGHEGWELQHFLELPSSQLAGLKREHVVALRLYTSDSFRLFNSGMRAKTKPHPIRFTVYVLNKALKKLRKVAAKQKPDEYNKTKVLWRGMKDMTLDFEAFKRTGGTELAPMSTTDDDQVQHTTQHTHMRDERPCRSLTLVDRRQPGCQGVRGQSARSHLPVRDAGQCKGRRYFCLLYVPQGEGVSLPGD